MYSFHPFGGLESHPYGGSGSFQGGLDLSLKLDPAKAAKDAANAGLNAAKRRLNRNKNRKPAPKPQPDPNAANTALASLRSGLSALENMKGEAARIASTVNFDTAAISRAKANLSSMRLAPATQQLAAQIEMEQAMMAAGGTGEEGFLSKYKNFVIIGGAVAVVGVAAFFMLRK